VDFITEDGYEVKLGMEEAYQQWVVDHADELRRATPDGVEYMGTYVMTYGNDTDRGTWRDLFRLDSYAALDRMAAATKDADGPLGRLFRESAQFIDMRRNPERWTHNLFKSVVDATVINSPAYESPEMVAVGPGRAATNGMKDGRKNGAKATGKGAKKRKAAAATR
jgi:hypothetical protein